MFVLNPGCDQASKQEAEKMKKNSKMITQTVYWLYIHDSYLVNIYLISLKKTKKTKQMSLDIHENSSVKYVSQSHTEAQSFTTITSNTTKQM